MPRDFNKCAEGANGAVITPKCRMIYPSLFETSLPRGEKDPDKATYNVVLLIPKNADMTMLKELVAEARDDEWSTKKQEGMKIKLPFKKTEDAGSFADLADDFPWHMRASTQYKPGVVSPAAKDVKDPSEAYSGRWACASLTAYTWKHDTGGHGVSLNLNNVHLLDNDDPIAAQRAPASEEFEPVGADEGNSAEDMM